jgi:hypothetical protein
VILADGIRNGTFVLSISARESAQHEQVLPPNLPHMHAPLRLNSSRSCQRHTSTSSCGFCDRTRVGCDLTRVGCRAGPALAFGACTGSCASAGHFGACTGTCASAVHFSAGTGVCT